MKPRNKFERAIRTLRNKEFKDQDKQDIWDACLNTLWGLSHE